MSVVDDLISAVVASKKIDAGTRAVLTVFLQEGGQAIAMLAPAALKDVVEQLASGDRAAAIETIAGSLAPQEVVTLLGAIQSEMDAAAEAHEASRAAGTALLGALESAAMTAIAQAIISAL